MDKRIEEIAKLRGNTANLYQLAEECAELSKACLKVARYNSGDKYVDGKKAEDNLAEEIADVQICIKAVECNYKYLVPKIEDYTEEKSERWFKRTFLFS